MKSPDEIKKGLECCSIDDYHCGEGCPYKDNCITENRYKALEADALALIQQLQDDNAQLNRCIENLTDKLNAMNDEVAKLQAERDALIDVVKDKGGACATCEHYSNEPDEIPCRFCIEMHPEDEDRISHWQWRGVQKEE